MTRSGETKQKKKKLPKWESHYNNTDLPSSEPSNSEHASPEPASSNYSPSSTNTKPSSPKRQKQRHQMLTRSQCAPSNITRSNDPQDSDPEPSPGRRKRSFSQLTTRMSSSGPVQRFTRQQVSGNSKRSRQQHHDALFCTQHCLLGLQQGGKLDERCPNMKLHQQGGNSSWHLINANDLAQHIKRQLDENLDHDCTPIGNSGLTGVPFKITCAVYGYTVVGKGTTSYLWNKVLREAQVYQVLRKAQGSAVPVFLGTINLKKTYFHEAGDIRHMLIMAWGGKAMSQMENLEVFSHEILRSAKEIRSWGVLHQDLRLDNILWNAELGRALIIDFHYCKLDPQPTKKRSERSTKYNGLLLTMFGELWLTKSRNSRTDNINPDLGRFLL